MKYVFIISLIVANFAQAAQQSVGSYSLNDMRKLALGCYSKELKSILLVPKVTAECPHSLRIKNIKITYDAGFEQQFEFPNQSGQRGSKLAITELGVLPGTKCISRINADVKIDSLKSQGRCVNSKLVEVVVTH